MSQEGEWDDWELASGSDRVWLDTFITSRTLFLASSRNAVPPSASVYNIVVHTITYLQS